MTTEDAWARAVEQAMSSNVRDEIEQATSQATCDATNERVHFGTLNAVDQVTDDPGEGEVARAVNPLADSTIDAMNAITDGSSGSRSIR